MTNRVGIRAKEKGGGGRGRAEKYDVFRPSPFPFP